METDMTLYFDEDFLENPTQPIKINGTYYDTEDVEDEELWLSIKAYFKDYIVEPMNANIDLPDTEADDERDIMEVFLLRILATGQLFTVSNLYDMESDAILTFYE